MKDELVFRELEGGESIFAEIDDTPVRCIGVGRWDKRNNGESFFSSQLYIVPKWNSVETNCGDSYMDYGISFDDFLAIADKIRELKKGEK